MSSFQIPNERGEIRQVNRGDRFGEIWSSFNLDFTSSPGKIKTSRRLTRLLDDTKLSSNDIQAITAHDGKYYAATTEEVLEAPNAITNAGSWSVNSTIGSGNGLGFETDLTSFDSALLISSGTNIHRYDGSFTSNWWTGTISGSSLTSNVPHIMHAHRGGDEALVVTDGNKIRYYTSAGGHKTVTLDANLTATCVASGISAVYAGTYTEIGDTAYVYEIYIGEDLNGTPVARRAYPVEGRAVLSMAVVDNVPYIVTETGAIQKLTGAGFSVVDYFPFAYGEATLSGVLPGSVQSTSDLRPVHPKGMKAHQRSLFIAINTEESASGLLPIDERSPSGIWEFDVDTRQLRHRYSFTDASTDYGVGRLVRVSSLYVPDVSETKVLVGGEVADGANTGIGLWCEDLTNTPQGYFVTPELHADTISELYEKLIVRAHTMANGESITVKYRTSKNANYPQYNDVNWISATSFTTTEASFANVQKGDEVEVITGYGAGKVVHITNIQTSTSTYTVTVDSEIGANAQTSTIRMQNWKLLSSTYTSTEKEFKQFGVSIASSWIQFKVVMKGNIVLNGIISKGNAKQTM